MSWPTGEAAGEPDPPDPLDAPIVLHQLVPRDELDEVAAGVATSARCRTAVIDTGGELLAGSEIPDGVQVAIEHHGEIVGWAVADAGHGGAAAHLAGMIGLLVHHAHARELSGLAHEAAITATYVELTQKNRSLEAAVARMRDTDRIKSNFLATMSHELRTPLTSVIGYSEMLLEGLAGPLTGEQKEYLTTILGKADQLLQLITAVLDMSRLEAAPASVEVTPVPVDEVVASVVASFAPPCQKRGIALATEIAAPLRVAGDRRQIRQVLWNLVSNAVKFTPDGGRIVVGVRIGPLVPEGVSTRPDARLAAHVEVTDSGIGIPREQLPHIFEPFFQVDSSSTREYGGSGLGLTLAKAYVEAHGGRMWVDSTPGRGSTFVASFPVVGEDARRALAARG
ncbi:MAG TPA: HAMP domain-containing sensor histidine kinase [Kofleriaceae bacterium]|nr:HAMP domain-containing sensor histidine kinase [Kofleriaceae bacterium]